MQIEIDVTKLERGTHIGRVKVQRGGKTFWRKQRVGVKEKPKEDISRHVEAEKDYSGKLYHSTSVGNARKIEKEGFQTKGKLAERYDPEQSKGIQTWSKYGFIYFNNDPNETKRYGDATFEINVKNLRVAGGTEYTDILSKYRSIWSEKIKSAINKYGFSSPEVEKLYDEREGEEDTTMTDLVTKEFNKKYDGMIGSPGDIIITNSDIIKNIRRIK